MTNSFGWEGRNLSTCKLYAFQIPRTHVQYHHDSWLWCIEKEEYLHVRFAMLWHRYFLLTIFWRNGVHLSTESRLLKHKSEICSVRLSCLSSTVPLSPDNCGKSARWCRSFMTKSYLRSTAGARRLFFSKSLPESQLERWILSMCPLLVCGQVSAIEQHASTKTFSIIFSEVDERLAKRSCSVSGQYQFKILPPSEKPSQRDVVTLESIQFMMSIPGAWAASWFDGKYQMQVPSAATGKQKQDACSWRLQNQGKHPSAC